MLADLVKTAGRTLPSAIVSPVVASDDVVLRSARWPSDGSVTSGTVLLCPGRSEFIEKYHEVVEELRARGFAVAVFDWRGQGLSARPLKNPQKGHVWTFDAYLRDLAAMTRQILEPFCPRPWYALAHSMGGPIVLRYAAQRPDVFDRIVLSAPMIELAGLRWPNLLRLLARTGRHSGLGRSFVPIRPKAHLFLSTFDGNVLTSDRARFDRTVALLAAEPRLTVGLPTVGWVHAAFKSMASMSEDAFIERVVTPTLFVLPGADAVVDNRAAERLSARLRASSLVTVPGARHEVLMERDTMRDQFWAAFDAFIPGSQRDGSDPRRPELTARLLPERNKLDGSGLSHDHAGL